MSLKIAILGTGKIARRQYIPNLVEHEDVTLCYYNRTRDKAEEIAREFGGRVAGSFHELMEDGPDAVLVLTRETDRYEAAAELLSLRPKRIFFEKPLVAQDGQAHVVESDFFRGRELLQRARDVGAETAMVFNYRFFEQTRLARELVASHDFGVPVHATGLVHYACWSHCIDLLLHFVGPVAEISALPSKQARPWGNDCAADVTVAFRTEGDATGTMIGTCGLDFGAPLYELTFAYERGRLSMRDLDGDMEVIDYAAEQAPGRHALHALSRNVSRWDQYSASFAHSINAYLDSIRAGAPPPIPGIAGLRELQFEAAIVRSIAESRPIVLADEFPLGL